MEKIINYLKEPRKLVKPVLLKFGGWLPDRIYLQLLYKSQIGTSLNLKDPKTYNEKLQWIKLYDRRPEYRIMVDKYEVKKYVSNKIGSEYIIKTLGVWDNVDMIDWDLLPNKFVMKATNGGGGNGIVICKDKKRLDIVKSKEELNKSLKSDIYHNSREWPYKNMKKRIIAEELLEEPGQDFLHDYKVMCFNGKVKLIEYHEGRFTDNHKQDFYDRDWHLTDITQGSYGEGSRSAAIRPECLDEMIRCSELLSDGIPHVRVDWYIVNNQLFFGEMTFFDGSGLIPWDRYEDELLMGSWITLPNRKMK